MADDRTPPPPREADAAMTTPTSAEMPSYVPMALIRATSPDRTPPPVPPATPSAIDIAAWYDNNVVVQAMCEVAFDAGVAAGRKQAAADLRAQQSAWRKETVVYDVLELAARIAEEPNHAD